MSRARETIRRISQDEHLFRSILDALEDRQTRLELAGRVEELDDRVLMNPARISEELFS